ncbi:hypothetical protein ACFO5R_06305 [Halosolutus amylolyticus]|uniref:Zinc-ribbon domain-containing protein n=1 Tax=Halosolutus amylolyticus TaxID=2932267 RepID=A0ABD5PLT8_9EURY|nr:hypothetical protein [Halosolutus amylolyticus]
MSVLHRVCNRNGRELYECRNCGEKLAEDADECPNCNWKGIAYYEF